MQTVTGVVGADGHHRSGAVAGPRTPAGFPPHARDPQRRVLNTADGGVKAARRRCRCSRIPFAFGFPDSADHRRADRGSGRGSRSGAARRRPAPDPACRDPARLVEAGRVGGGAAARTRRPPGCRPRSRHQRRARRRARPPCGLHHQIRAHPVDVERGTQRGDLAQLVVAQDHISHPLPRPRCASASAASLSA